MKIRIIGGPGSGKSFLAKELSKRYGIPHYDLDELFWKNEAGPYGTKRDPQERDAMLERILREENWIIEGVYYAWCLRCFEDADKIYLLDVPRYQYRHRIIRRVVRRKLALEDGKRETLRSVSELLKWADHYREDTMPQIRQLLAAYAEKVTER